MHNFNWHSYEGVRYCKWFNSLTPVDTMCCIICAPLCHKIAVYTLILKYKSY